MTTISKDKISRWLTNMVAILALLGVIGTYGTMRAKNALLEDKVDRHEQLLNEYNIPVMNNKVETMAEDIQDIKADLRDFIRDATDYFRSQ